VQKNKKKLASFSGKGKNGLIHNDFLVGTRIAIFKK